MGESLPTVLVTGFGPFSNHVENSSWITVQELAKMNIANYNLVTKELPVSYNIVSQVVPLLWQEHKPKLTVHCGMSETRSCITIEKLARKKGYFHCDINGLMPNCNECCSDGNEVIYSAIDVSKVVDDVSCSPVCVKTELSEDAGLYLCEFSYYTSLNINRNTIFVHIPAINNPYNAQEMGETLAAIISSTLKQLKS